MSDQFGRALLARHIDCPGVCDVWVERDAILAIHRAAVLAAIDRRLVAAADSATPGRGDNEPV